MASQELLSELQSIKFKGALNKNRRDILVKVGRGSGSLNLGIVQRTFTSYIGNTVDTDRYPKLWQAVRRYAMELNPDFKWTTVTINKNIRCAPHLDKKNNGDTMIVTVGDFTGGRLWVEPDGFIDIKDKPYYFNGSKVLHSTEEFTGTRYSLMFYNYIGSGAPSEPDADAGKVVTVKAGGVGGVDILVRKGTTDEKCIKEIFHDNVYQMKSIGFLVEPQDKWLDLGANIGVFSLFVKSKGASVVAAYEPHPDNFDLLKRNFCNQGGGCEGAARLLVTADGTEDKLYVCRNPNNKYRHTVKPVRGRAFIGVESVKAADVIRNSGADCIKMDIEGAEIAILESLTADGFDTIRKLVFEYSFDMDNSIPRFMAIIRRLRDIFPVVHYDKVREDELTYNYFPMATMVYCAKL